MERYHKKIFFPISNDKKLNDAVISLNNKKISLSKHAIEKLKNRIPESEYSNISHFFSNMQLKIDDIIEYYVENNIICKLVFRMKYNQYKDIILIMNLNKTLITLYLNNSTDEHETLRHELYNQK